MLIDRQGLGEQGQKIRPGRRRLGCIRRSSMRRRIEPQGGDDDVLLVSK